MLEGKADIDPLEEEDERKTDTHQEGGGDLRPILRPVRRRRYCGFPLWCRAGCCGICMFVTIIVGVYGGRFAYRLKKGLDYMHEEMQHTVDALSLNNHSLRWYHLDDVVMGGHSRSYVEATKGGSLRFAGTIDTNDGGFSSCSTLEEDFGLSASVAGFNVTVEGNGELFKFTVKTSESVWEPVWQIDLPTPSLEAGVTHSFYLPLASFAANRMGKAVHGAVLDPTRIMSVGLNLALIDMYGDANPHFADGPFELLLHSVAAVEAS